MSVMKPRRSRFERGFRLGSEGDDGTHLRDTSGWPYSIYLRDDNVGGSDAVLCLGIQNLTDAEHLLAICNGAEHPAIESPLQIFAWAKA
jgi:hypothetical protein